jgi:signal transduction histidine kinase
MMYAVIFLLATTVSLIVACLAWQRRATPGGRSLAFLMLALAVWSFAEVCELWASGASAKIAWSKMSYLGAVPAPLLTLMFVLEYTRQPPRPRSLGVLALLPLATLLLVFTNEWHGWVWDRVQPIPSDLEILGYGHGMWFWINAAYAYTVLLGALFALASASARASQAYRQQAFALFASILIPFVFNAIYIFGWSPVAGLDLSPLAFSLCGLLIAFGIFRLRLLELAPMARDALFESLSDGVIVLDAQDRIVDINPAARELLGAPAVAIGENVANLPLNGSIPAHGAAPTAFHPIEIQRGSRWLDLRAAPIFTSHRIAAGRLIVLRDITARKEMESTLEEMAILRERQRLARDLHDSVTQSLSSLVLVAYTATNRLRRHKYDRLDALIEQLSEGARQALKETRLLLYDLQLAPTEHTNLADALALRLETVEKRAGIDTQFSAENVPVLAAMVEHELYLFAMEALNNSLKHANATQVIVSLRGGGKDLSLAIEDDGKGFDPQAVRAGGMGLGNLRARAEKISGQLAIDSALGKGTRVRLTLSLSSAKFPEFLGGAQ